MLDLRSVFGKESDPGRPEAGAARLWALRGADGPDEIYVRLPPEMDHASAGQVVKAVRGIPRDWSIVFDVRRLEFIDAAGAAELADAMEDAATTHANVSIRGPFAPAVERLLRLTDGLFALES